MAKHLRDTLLTLYILVWSLSAYGKSNYLGIADGLSNRHVSVIMQDRNGLMWIGTENGLNIYDGYSFKQYFTYTKDISLSSSRIASLLEDKDGSVWVGTYAGLNHISADRRHNMIIPEVATLRITSIVQQQDGAVLFATDDGCIYRIGPRSSRPDKVFCLGKRCGLFGLATDRRKNIYFHTDCERTIYRLLPDFSRDISFIFRDTLFSRFEIRGNIIIASCKSQDGMGMFSVDGLTPINNPLFRKLNSLYPKAKSFFIDSEKNIWVGYSNGMLIKINTGNGTLQNFSSYFVKDYFGSRVHTIFEDRQGLIWVATDGGIVKATRSSDLFSMNTLLEDKHVSCRGIETDKAGNAYITSNQGLFTVDRNNHALNYRVAENPDQNDNSFTAASMRDDRNLMVATINKGLLNFNLASKKLTPLIKNDTGKTYKDLISIFDDRSGTVYIGSHRGLKVYNPATRIIREFNDPSNDTILPKTSVWKIIEYKGLLWLATTKGLFCVDKTRGVTRRYHLFSDVKLPAQDIYCITPDDEYLWLGTRGGGIIRLSVTTGKITHYTPENGLCNNVVYGIIKYRAQLYISTENGLSRFDKSTGTFTNYYTKDGLSDNEFNAGSYHIAGNGRIFLGGINGITSFYPDAIKQSANLSHIVVTSVQAGDSILQDVESLNSGNPISVTLENNNMNLSINMTVTDFYQPTVNTFSYKIIGLDDEWTNLGTQHFIRFNQFPPGNYRILIRGKNFNGIETVNTFSMNIAAEQVFYKKTWFIIVLFISALLLFYAFFRMRILELIRMQKLRAKIASDLHDEVGSMLTRISILSEMLKFKNKDSNEVREIALASNKATTMMSDMLWSIDSRNDKVENLVDRMREHADSLLLPLDIAIDFSATQADNGTILDMQFRQNLLFIFKEAINNIAKHSGASNVQIRSTLDQQLFHLEISDNGAGGSASHQGSGQGLANMRMRAAEIRASIDIRQDNGFHISITRKL